MVNTTGDARAGKIVGGGSLWGMEEGEMREDDGGGVGGGRGGGGGKRWWL